MYIYTQKRQTPEDIAIESDYKDAIEILQQKRFEAPAQRVYRSKNNINNNNNNNNIESSSSDLSDSSDVWIGDLVYKYIIHIKIIL